MQPNNKPAASSSASVCAARARLDVRVGLGEAEVVVLLLARPLLARVVRPLGVVRRDDLPRLDRLPSLLRDTRTEKERFGRFGDIHQIY